MIEYVSLVRAFRNTDVLHTNDQKFKSAGTFYYKDIENPQSEVVVTILNNGEKDNSMAIHIE